MTTRFMSGSRLLYSCSYYMEPQQCQWEIQRLSVFYDVPASSIRVSFVEYIPNW